MILTTVALFSCTNEKVQLISNFEQQLSENVKIDLKFKCKSFEKINDVYSIDSVKYFQDVIIKLTKWSADSIEYKTIELSKIKKVKNYSGSYGYKIDKLINAEKCNHTELTNEGYTDYVEKTLQIFKSYKNMSNTLLCTKYKCVYTIFNPIMNAKQEITKTYCISLKNEIINTDFPQKKLQKWEKYL